MPPFSIVLKASRRLRSFSLERVENPQDRRHGPEQQDAHAPAGVGTPQPARADADEAVEAGVDEAPRHEGRDVARSGRVRLGEPDVQGDDAGLHAEADEEQDEEEAAPRARDRGAAEEIRESQRARPGGEEEERGDEAARAEVGHGEIEKRRAAARPALVIGRDERGGGEAHQLPGHEEAEDAVGREHRLDRHQEHVPGHADERGPAGRYRVGQVAHAVDGHRRRQHGERHEEPRRERVDGVPDAHPGGRVREEDAADGPAAREHRRAEHEAGE